MNITINYEGQSESRPLSRLDMTLICSALSHYRQSQSKHAFRENLPSCRGTLSVTTYPIHR